MVPTSSFGCTNAGDLMGAFHHIAGVNRQMSSQMWCEQFFFLNTPPAGLNTRRYLAIPYLYHGIYIPFVEHDHEGKQQAQHCLSPQKDSIYAESSKGHSANSCIQLKPVHSQFTFFLWFSRVELFPDCPGRCGQPMTAMSHQNVLNFTLYWQDSIFIHAVPVNK